MELYNYWQDFLHIVAALIGLSSEQKAVFQTRFSLENTSKSEAEIASLIGIDEKPYKKRKTKVYASFKQIYPELKSTHKYEAALAWLKERYQDWLTQEPAADPWDYWDDFLMLYASKCEFSPEVRDVLKWRFAQDNKGRSSEELAEELGIGIEAYKKRMTAIYAGFKRVYPLLERLKFKQVLAFLEQEYQQWPPKEQAGRSMTRLFQERRFYVKDVFSEEDVRYVSKMENSEYGSEVFPYEILLSWWQQFPDGIKALFCEERMIGIISLWPLSIEEAIKFKKGEIGETQLVPSSLASVRNHSPRFWYVGAIAVEKNVRRTAIVIALKTLLLEALQMWIEKDYIHYPVELLALGYSRAGTNMLENAAFNKLGMNMVDSLPLYSCQVKNKEQWCDILSRWCGDVEFTT